MSIKPSVVFIKGVHSTTGSDKTSDIGFPQLELEKLFESAVSKEVGSGDTYSSGKKYIYYDPSNSQVTIQNEGHFNCIKNGYYSIADGVNHYYTLSGNNYNYNTVPDTSTWAGKWSFSNAIKNKTLYSISPESNKICVNNSSYYEKSGNNYINQTVKTYDLYKEGQRVLWDNSRKYTRKTKLDMSTLQNITTWESENTLAIDGYYLSVDEKQNSVFTIKLLYCTFKNGVLQDNFTNLETLYKLDTDNSFGSSTWYIKNGNKLEMMTANTDIVFNTNPTENSSFYLYQRLGPYTYPNTVEPVSASLYTDSGDSIYKNFNINNFPSYTIATATEISKMQYDSYTVYEKSDVKVNYNYSADANSLKFVFTDKTISETLDACGLPDNIGLEKYVHLTNLEYNK